jgi:hypothetical protein
VPFFLNFVENSEIKSRVDYKHKGELSMKIILLSGEPKSEKSTALRLLYDKLTKDLNYEDVSKKRTQGGL